MPTSEPSAAPMTVPTPTPTPTAPGMAGARYFSSSSSSLQSFVYGCILSGACASFGILHGSCLLALVFCVR
jgi:hypothetical protein